MTCDLFLSINNLTQSQYAKHAQRVTHNSNQKSFLMRFTVLCFTASHLSGIPSFRVNDARCSGSLSYRVARRLRNFLATWLLPAWASNILATFLCWDNFLWETSFWYFSNTISRNTLKLLSRYRHFNVFFFFKSLALLSGFQGTLLNNQAVILKIAKSSESKSECSWP